MPCTTLAASGACGCSGLASSGAGGCARAAPGSCGTTLNVCVQTVKALATLMAPFLPFSATKCATMLSVDGFPWEGGLEELPAGHELGEPVVLFRKLEVEDFEAPAPEGA